jgi:hypothetical protein
VAEEEVGDHEDDARDRNRKAKEAGDLVSALETTSIRSLSC